MKHRNLHSWKVSPQEAVQIQKKLFRRLILKNTFSKIERIAAADVSFPSAYPFPAGEDREGLLPAGRASKTKVRSAIVVLSFPQLEILETVKEESFSSYPYIPGLLTFREGPPLLSAFARVKEVPDLIIFDGQGIAHPRGMGLAAHLGILLEKPSIGCAKSLLWGTPGKLGNFKGACSPLRDRKGQTIGALLRTRKNVRPVFVSPGYKIDLAACLRIILASSPKYRIPEPLRQAHLLSQGKGQSNFSPCSLAKSMLQ